MITSKCHYSCETCIIGQFGEECLSCLADPVDSDRIKWSGRVLNPSTNFCECKDGYLDIGSKDCYNKKFNQEVVIQPIGCIGGQYFSTETLKCEQCDPKCQRCEAISTYCTRCDFSRNRVLNGSECVCRNEFREDQNGDCKWLKEEQFKSAETGIFSVLVASTGTAVPILMGSAPMVFFQYLNIVEYVYFLMFTQINYPIKVERFLKLFGQLQLKFLPDMFEDRRYHMLSQKGFERRAKDALFLRNMSDQLVLIFLTSFIYLILKLITRFVIKTETEREQKQLFFRVVKKLEQKFEYSVMISVGQFLLLNLAVFSFLQLLNSACQSQIQIASFLSAYLFFAAIFIYLFNVQRGIGQYLNRDYRILRERIYLKYQFILGQLKLENIFQVRYFFVYQLRRVGFGISLVMLNNYVLEQQVVFLALSLSILFILVKYKPYFQRRYQLRDVINEIVYSTIHISCIFLSLQNDQSESLMSEALYYSLWVILVYSTGFVVYDSVLAIKQMISPSGDANPHQQQNVKIDQDSSNVAQKQLSIEPQDAFNVQLPDQSRVYKRQAHSRKMINQKRIRIRTENDSSETSFQVNTEENQNIILIPRQSKLQNILKEKIVEQAEE